MTNEWGAPLTGEEMKTLKGRIDPEAIVKPEGYNETAMAEGERQVSGEGGADRW